MYLWELIAQRLRVEGWDLWQRKEPGPGEPTYTVTIQRPGVSWRVSGPTLTEALAEAARRAHSSRGCRDSSDPSRIAPPGKDERVGWER